MTSSAQVSSLMNLPRELRDEIISHLALPGFVYTSSEKPNTANLHRGVGHAATFVDTRIYLPCRVAPNVLGVCRQLREECLQYHAHMLHSFQTSPSTTPTQKTAEDKPTSNILAERLGAETDEEVERLGDHSIRITLEVQRGQRGRFGYFEPVREDLSPRFLALLPLMEGAKKLRLVVWPGYDWWNGSRPRAIRRVNGRLKLEAGDSGASDPAKPDAVSFAIGKVLEHFPAVEDLSVDVMAYVGIIARWDLPDQKWENIQYWLDGPVTRQGGEVLKKVSRKLAAVWNPTLYEAFYEQEEVRIDEKKTWRVKRRGDMRTPTVLSIAEPGELDEFADVVNETLERLD